MKFLGKKKIWQDTFLRMTALFLVIAMSLSAVPTAYVFGENEAEEEINELLSEQTEADRSSPAAASGEFRAAGGLLEFYSFLDYDYTLTGAWDSSPLLADFTRGNIVDWVHVTGNTDLSASDVQSNGKKDTAAEDRIIVKGTATKNFSEGAAANVGLPIYNDGAVLTRDNDGVVTNVGADVTATGNAAVRREVAAFAGPASSLAITAPSADGQTRTLEIYVGTWDAKAINVTASMGTEELSSVNGEIPGIALTSSDEWGYKYVFVYTGNENEDPLTVNFNLAAFYTNENWCDIKFGAACILEGEPDGAPAKHKITINPIDNATVSVTRADGTSVTEFREGTEVTLTAKADKGYKLASLKVDNVDIMDQLTNGQYKFTPTDDVTISGTTEVDTTVYLLEFYDGLSFGWAEANGLSNWDDSPALADFTRSEVVDWVHATNVDASTITSNGKQGVENSDRIRVTGSGPKRGFLTDNRLFVPKYTNGVALTRDSDGVVTGAGTAKIEATGTNAERQKDMYFEGMPSKVTITAPSVVGETRTLEIYIGTWDATIDVTAKMGDEKLSTAASSVPFIMNSSGLSTGYKLVFVYTGNEDADPLEVVFDVTAGGQWVNLRFTGACILDGAPPAKYQLTANTIANAAVSFTAAGNTVTEVMEGVEVTLNAVPSEGYYFSSLTMNGMEIKDQLINGQYKFRPTGDVIITGTAELDTGGVVTIADLASTPLYKRTRQLDTPTHATATGHTGTLGIPQIDDNLSAPNTVDWLRLLGGTNMNSKNIEDPDAKRLTFSSTANYGNDQYEKGANLRLTYTDGTNPLGDSSSYSLAIDGGEVGTFSAPSKANVERTLDVYASLLNTKGPSNNPVSVTPSITISGSMGGVTVEPVSKTWSGTGNSVIKFTIKYTGSPSGLPLTLNFTGNGWINFYGARITEGEAKPQIMMTVPDMQAAGYAVSVPDSLFSRRDLSVRAFDADGTEVTLSEDDIDLSYVAVSPPAAAGSTNLPGVTIEDGMLYVRSGLTTTAEIDITAKAEVNGEEVSVTRRATIVYNGYKDFDGTDASSDTPLGQSDGDWQLYYNEDFDGEELDTTAWSDYYLRSWEGKENYSKAQYEMVEEDGETYLALTSSDDMTPWTGGINAAKDDYDGTHRVSSLVTFDRQNLHLGDAGRAFYEDSVPVFDGGDINTKYGYFEIRLRQPNTGDGSHFAWWMIGVQDDQHPVPVYAGPKPSDATSGDYAHGTGAWGEYTSYFTNQGVEYDILESSLDKNGVTSNSPYNGWLPVQHKNGSRDIEYWFAGYNEYVAPADRYYFANDKDDGYTNGRNAYNEFHVYGYEWDETGTKFYVDGDLVYTTPNSASYRMMTFLSVYTGKADGRDGSYGYDHGYWPKEAMIDYLRIYKRAEDPKPNEVVLNTGRNTAWDYFQVPASGENVVQLSAYVVDQFNQPYTLKDGESLKWRFSDTVGGENELGSNAEVSVNYGSDTVSATQHGPITLNPDTGELTVPAGTSLDRDLFVTAYVDGVDTGADPNFDLRKVRATKHVKLSSEAPKASYIIFENPAEIARNSSETLNAKVYDQYMNVMPDATVTYSLSEDITAQKSATVTGISISSDTLKAAAAAETGKVFIVTAKAAGGLYQSLPMTVVPDVIYDVTVEASDNGTVTADPTEGIIGTEIELTIEPEDKFELDTLLVNEVPLAADENGKYIFQIEKDTTVKATFKEIQEKSYTVTVEPSVNGAVTADPTSGKAGTVVELTVKPNSGYELDTLLVNGATLEAEANGKYVFAIQGNTTVKATFKELPPNTYAVTIEPSVNGTVSANPASGAAGTVVELTVEPNSGYELDTLLVNGNTLEAEANGKYVFAIQGATTVSATFKKLPPNTYAVTIEPSVNGTVSANPASGAAGTVVELTVEPNSGYELDTLLVNGNTLEAEANGKYVFAIQGNTTVKATFKELPPNTYAVEIEASVNGTVVANPASGVAGTAVELTAEPNEGYVLDTILVNGTDLAADAAGKYIFQINGVTTVRATFKKTVTPLNKFRITVSSGGGGTASIAPTGGEYTEGTAVTLTAAALSNYSFAGWYENGVRVTGAQAVYSFSVTGNRSLEARFSRNSSGGGSSGGSSGSSGSNSGSSSGGSNTPAPSTPSAPPAINVVVDGEEKDIGDVQVVDNKTVISIPQAALDEQIASANESVVIPLSNVNTSAIEAQLAVKNIEEINNKNITLSVSSDKIRYEIPAQAIDTAALMASIGASDTAAVPISITINQQVDTATEDRVTNAIDAMSGRVVVPAVEFTVTAHYDGRDVEVNTFDSYVARTVEVERNEYEQITTAVVVEPDGTLRHVPTNVYNASGKYYAAINSRTNSTYVLVYNNVEFSDAVGKWYEKTANEMGSRRIMVGTSNDSAIFNGEAEVSRAEFASIIVNALGLPAQGKENIFTDVNADAPLRGAVAAAYDYGIVSGRGDRIFDPDSGITWEEAMAMIQRAAVIAGFEGNNEGGGYTASQASDWAADAVSFYVNSELFVPAGRLELSEAINRAEMATAVLDLLRKAELVDVR